MLRTLEAEGLIEQEPGDERKSYRLTSSGHDALRRWIAEEPDALPVQRNELLLKLFFARHDTLEQTLTKIRHHERLLRERLDTYEAIETMIQANDPDSPDAVYWLLTLDYGKRQTHALIDWCEAAVCTLKGGDENGTENGRPNEDVVVFIIGLRVNRLRSIRTWWPVFNAMPAMFKGAVYA